MQCLCVCSTLDPEVPSSETGFLRACQAAACGQAERVCGKGRTSTGHKPVTPHLQSDGDGSLGPVYIPLRMTELRLCRLRWVERTHARSGLQWGVSVRAVRQACRQGASRTESLSLLQESMSCVAGLCVPAGPPSFDSITPLTPPDQTHCSGVPCMHLMCREGGGGCWAEVSHQAACCLCRPG